MFDDCCHVYIIIGVYSYHPLHPTRVLGTRRYTTPCRHTRAPRRRDPRAAALQTRLKPHGNRPETAFCECRPNAADRDVVKRCAADRQFRVNIADVYTAERLCTKWFAFRETWCRLNVETE